MGKKEKSGGNLGKALIRDRFGTSKNKRNSGDPSMLHTADINDGYDWGRLNLQSVTEESSFQEFLSTAELAGTEFHAEKLNITFVNSKSGIGLLSNDEKEKVLKMQEANKVFLKIPRRPKWDESTTASELENLEKENFLEWRRQLAMLQEEQGLLLTPYEKNLEFWRQLWRVIERSDIVVQIVDARNPLLFRCEDLESYVKEINPKKMNMILINKADFLTKDQRLAWAKYFSDNNIRIAFFSATLAVQKAETEQEEDLCNLSELKPVVEEIETQTENESRIQDSEKIKNSPELLSREQLIALFRTIYKNETYTNGITTIGLVGYPNVGKSSTINALLMDKKVSVSATPGKTKHFQTLFVEKDLLLCDCPGLVMPSFVSTKAEMVLNGILPIDQMRDHVPPVTLLGTLIPRHVIEDLYGIMLPLPVDGEDPNRPPTAEEILNAYGYNRGFMTQNGQPDNPRSARYVLKDFVNGKLLYCTAPPDCEQECFHVWPPRKRNLPPNRQLPPRAERANRGSKTTTEDLDKVFFQHNNQNVHVKGVHGKLSNGPPSLICSNAQSVSGSMESLSLQEKPWKKMNKHINKKKREKSRRLYAHLDQH